MKRTKSQCSQCGCLVSLSNLGRHVGSVSCLNGGKGKTKPEKYPWGQWRVGEDWFRLPSGYEGTKSACRNKLNNLSAQETGGWNLETYNQRISSGEIAVHNKGMETSGDHKLKLSASLKKHWKNHKISEGTAHKLSIARKEYLQKNPDKQLNALMASNRNRMTYPEKVASGWFEKKGIPAIYNARVGKFFPDFLVGMCIVEIDGERWHSTPDQVKRDSERDRILVGLGYTVERIRSSQRIEQRLEVLLSQGFFTV